MVEADEPVLVEAFITQPSVKGFDVRVLVRLTGLDQTKGDAVTMCPLPR